MKNLYTLILLIFIGFQSLAQKAEKVMEKDVFAAIDARSQADIDENMDKAKDNFEKVLSKDPNSLMSNFGLSVVYSYDEYTGKDYFKAWKHFRIAYDGQKGFTADEIEVLGQYFPKIDLKRRNRPINKNMEWEKIRVEDKLIKFVREENNTEYAEKFLNEFPDSRYYNNVMHIRNYIEYRIAEEKNSVEAFNAFVEKYPDAAQKNVAIAKRNQLAYKNAIAANTLQALIDFTVNFPDAIQVQEANKLMGVMAYAEVEKTRSLEAVEQFMQEYPNSSKMPNAKLLKKQLLFEHAKSVNTMQAYNAFVALYPEGQMYIDIFNLKASALGEKVLMDFPIENYAFVKGFDNQEFSDYGGNVVVRPDGSILLVANSLKAEGEMYDSWVLGLDATGKMEWNKILGNIFDDQVNKVAVSSNNEIFVAGITNAIKDSIPGKSWIYKLGSDGKNMYNRKLEGSEVLALALYNAGDALIGGYITENDSLVTPLITKVNKIGKKLWSRNYSNKGKVFDITLYDNIAYVAAGNWIFAIDEKGYLVWDKFLEGNKNATTVGYSNGSIVFSGLSEAAGFSTAFDTEGNEVWNTELEVGNGQFLESEPLSDGSMVVAGTFNNKIQIFQLNTDGSIKTHKQFANSNGIELNGITITSDGAAIISSTLLGSQTDIIVFKLVL